MSFRSALRNLRDALFLARGDLRMALRTRETLLWTFVMPLIFFYFLGTVTGSFASDMEAQDTPLALSVGRDAGFLAEALATRLEEQGYSLRRDLSPEDFAREARRLVIPDEFTSRVLAGDPQEVQVALEDPSPNGAQLDRVRLQKSVYLLLADLVLAEEKEGEASPAALSAVRALPRSLKLDVHEAGTRLEPPSGFEQTIPGTLVMFTMLILLTGGSTLLLVERQQGLLRRLASAPLSRGAIVLGKWLGKMGIALIQIAFAMLAGTLFFGMDWGAALPAVCSLLFAWAAFNASLSLLLANLSDSESAISAIGVLSSMFLAALGGCWWPIEITPDWMQRLALFLPTGLTMNGLHRLISFGAPGITILPHAAILVCAALLLGWLAARRFRFT